MCWMAAKLSTDDNSSAPTANKQGLKLSLNKPKFAQPLGEVDMNTLCQTFVPSNTCKQTNQAVNDFELWRSTRNSEKCPTHLLTKQCTVKELNDWLCQFVVEPRFSDGKPYPSTTLYQLLAGLLRYAHSEYADFPNFLDK